MLSAVARIVSQPINAWLSLLIALLLPSVEMSGAAAPAAAPLRAPEPFPPPHPQGRAGLGPPLESRGERDRSGELRSGR